MDGARLLECLHEVVRLVKKGGGFVCLDNSDVQSDERLKAYEVLLSAAGEKGGHVTKFVDYISKMFLVTEGTLVEF